MHRFAIKEKGGVRLFATNIPWPPAVRCALRGHRPVEAGAGQYRWIECKVCRARARNVSAASALAKQIATPEAGNLLDQLHEPVWESNSERAEASAELYWRTWRGLSAQVKLHGSGGISTTIHVDRMFAHLKLRGPYLPLRVARWIYNDGTTSRVRGWDSYVNSRVIGFSVHGGMLFLRLLDNDDGYSSHNQPKWRSPVLHYRRLIRGEPHLDTVPLAELPGTVVMPEGEYRATVTVEHCIKTDRFSTATWWRAEVHTEHPIPVPGKGENSWDCDEDAIYDMSCQVPEGDLQAALVAALSKLRSSAMRDREVYGNGAAWRPEHGPYGTLTATADVPDGAEPAEPEREPEPPQNYTIVEGRIPPPLSPDELRARITPAPVYDPDAVLVKRDPVSGIEEWSDGSIRNGTPDTEPPAPCPPGPGGIECVLVGYGHEQMAKAAGLHPGVPWVHADDNMWINPPNHINLWADGYAYYGGDPELEPLLYAPVMLDERLPLAVTMPPVDVQPDDLSVPAEYDDRPLWQQVEDSGVADQASVTTGRPVHPYRGLTPEQAAAVDAADEDD